ncbi:MAG: ATP-binding protein [Thomasclavelia ramosa]
MFNRFYQADESRAQNNNNFGLGLAIAKRICSYYDYAITVESIVDQYTIFTIDFERR